jgi:polyketide synthase Type III
MFPNAIPQITAVGKGLSPNDYTQQEILDFYKITSPKIRSLFLNSAIERRHLTLPPVNSKGIPQEETQSDLIKKHANIGLAMGRDAILNCLKETNAQCSDVRYICCVSSTGLLTPGFSALLIKALRLRQDCARLDVVGMGCNAGLNALSAVSSWTQAHPEQLAILVCIEVCSAAYVFDETMRTCVVNSLFGDGAAAISVIQKSRTKRCIGPSLLCFKSFIIPEEIDSMRYDWDSAKEKLNFFLAPEVPYVIGAHANAALKALLDEAGIRQSAIKHWLVHSGGKKVIDSVRVNLGLTEYDMRHTIATLQKYGNVSSGSFLFSYNHLLSEGNISLGDYGLMMTMGPGATIEMALIHWH